VTEPITKFLISLFVILCSESCSLIVESPELFLQVLLTLTHETGSSNISLEFFIPSGMEMG
jgi:hypothetical protein